MKSHFLFALIVAPGALCAQTRPDSTRRDSAATLQRVKITAERAPDVKPLQALTLPVTASIKAGKVEETINALDPEDAVKYLPSVFLRKRNNGDTQATMGTRSWGVSSSARTLVFADGVPLTALIANNNTIGAPRWGLVSPVEIARIDMMYGPFSAAYAGNSMGAVMEITTRMPERLEGSIAQTHAVQSFDLYGTNSTYGTAQTNGNVGDRFGRLSFWASGNYQKSHSQPLGYVTSGAFPTGTTGGFADRNKLGAAANVLGATGLLNTGMTNGKLKLAYDLTPGIRAAYSYGFWRNDASSNVDAYTAKSGEVTYAGQAGFATGYYDVLQQHHSQSLSVRSDFKADWDFETTASLYQFDKDRQRSPTTASANGTTFGTTGRVAVLDGTGWTTLDAKGTWHRGGLLARHVVSFGAHLDRYELNNPTFNTSEWTLGDYTTVATEGDGKTQTHALWLQDGWHVTPFVKLTVGGRYEQWRGYDGYNVNGATKVIQPTMEASRFSPKAVVAWTATPTLSVTASLGKAYRFATAAELYQLVSTGTTFTSPNPVLKPDNDLSSELRVRRDFSRGMLQMALFQDDVHDAIISQFLPLVPNSPALYSYISNVDHVRSRGLELALGANDVLIHGLELSGSATWLDAKTLALAGRASATAPEGSAVGKQLPNIPDRRATFLATYKPVDGFALSVAGRYSGKLYTTLDNADVNPNTYQGFSEWFVADAHLNYRLDRHWAGSIGADNVFNRKYFLFHPFPQRTFVGELKYAF